MTITLIRKQIQGKAVTGIMAFLMHNRDFEMEQFEIPSLENADFLIPEGIYPVERTWSPKFKKFLPEILEVPDRTGIRIHRGTLPEHSKGCVLTDMRGMALLDVLFNKIDLWENGTVQIDIRSEQAKD